ncbi:MAG TPA: PD-(D/E)XK motif protein [Kribbellaceae bacterium]|nr:PD-(D/E)XK motif protein [Kribbellaceae bacterium]
MTVDEQAWGELERDRTAPGTVTRRLFRRRDLHIAVRHPDGRRMLILRMSPADAAQVLRAAGPLPRTRGIDLAFERTADGHSELQVALTDPQLREVFNPLVSDIAVSVRDTSSSIAAGIAVVERFEHWRSMLQAVAANGMGPEARRGLYGELWVLRYLLLLHLPHRDAVLAWTGPFAANQDFQLTRAAVEVKTATGKQPQTLVVANERELDDSGTGNLILTHLSLDERRGGDGESMNAMIDALRTTIVGAATLAEFEDRLLRVGMLPHQRPLYEEPRYTLRATSHWRVTGDFPRITEKDLRSGVGDCRYRITTTGLDQYLITTDMVTDIIRGNDG